MKVTDWFPGDVKPVRPGCYECRATEQSTIINRLVFDASDGTWWQFALFGYLTIEWKPVYQWRGLAEKP